MLSGNHGVPQPPQALLASLLPPPSLWPMNLPNIPSDIKVQPLKEKKADPKIEKLKERLLERLDDHDCLEMTDSATKVLCVEPVFTPNGKAHDLDSLKAYWKELIKINANLLRDVIPGEEKEVASKFKPIICPKTKIKLGQFEYIPIPEELDQFVDNLIKNFKFIRNTYESEQLTQEFKMANEERNKLVEAIGNLKDECSASQLFQDIKKFHDYLKVAETRAQAFLKKIEFQNNFKEAYKLKLDENHLRHWQTLSSTCCIARCLPSYQPELVRVQKFSMRKEVANIITAANTEYKSVDDFAEGIRAARRQESASYQLKMQNRKWYERLFCCFGLSQPEQELLNIVVPNLQPQQRK